MAVPAPQVYFRLDESSGDAVDQIVPLTAVNTNVTYTTGILNNCAVYNGSAFHTVSDNAALKPVNAISFGGWIYITSTSSFQMVCAKGENAGDTRSYEMRMFSTTTQPEVQMRSGAAYIQARATTAIGTGTWAHVMYTRSGTSHQIYINGVSDTLASSVTQAGDIAYSTDAFWLGQRNGGLRLRGRIDEFGIWNVQLSSSEVSELYNGGAGFDPTAGGGGYRFQPFTGFAGL